jgi:hypothetical protein
MVFAHGGELVGRALKAQGISTLYTLCGGTLPPFTTVPITMAWR